MTLTDTDLRRAQSLARKLDPLAYLFGGIGPPPRGIDCSGFMSALINSLKGESNLYHRLFATGNIKDRAAALGLQAGLGDAGDFNLGVMFPWESGSGIGHMAGTLGGLNVESRGGFGVLLGSDARSARAALFKHHWYLPIKNATAPSWPPWPGRYLKLGSRGDDVRRYQVRMRQRGWALDADAIFGPQTDKVTRAFQREKRLTVDGIVGPATWKAAFTLPITNV